MKLDLEKFKNENPNIEAVNYYLKQWNNSHYKLEEEVSKELIKKFKYNNNLIEVMIKVAIRDSFYSTNITKHIKYPQMAEYIIKLNNELDLDNKLYAKNLSKETKKVIVDKIANIPLELKINPTKKVSLYSFATKYCALHNDEEFVIYDSFVDKMLRVFQKRDSFSSSYHKRDDLKDYAKFISILNEFMKFYKLTCTLRELDIYLWLLGKEIFK